MTDLLNRRKFLVYASTALSSSLLLKGCNSPPTSSSSDAISLPTIQATTQNSSGSPIPISIAESEGYGWSVVYVAKTENFWNQFGLDPQTSSFDTGRLAMEAVLAQKADFSTTADTPVVLSALRGLRPIIVASFSRSSKEMVVVGRTDKGVETPEALKGKKVATAVGTSGHYFLSEYLKVHGLAAQDIQLINLKPPDMVTALIKGDIDAYSWDWRSAQVAKAQANGNVTALPTDKIEPAWVSHRLLLTHDKVVQEKPEAIARAAQALLASEKFIQENRDQAIAHVAERTKTSKEATVTGFDVQEVIVNLDDQLLDNLVKQAEWAAENDLAKLPSGDLRSLYRELIYDTALKQADASRVTLS